MSRILQLQDPEPDLDGSKIILQVGSGFGTESEIILKVGSGSERNSFGIGSTTMLVEPRRFFQLGNDPGSILLRRGGSWCPPPPSPTGSWRRTPSQGSSPSSRTSSRLTPSIRYTDRETHCVPTIHSLIHSFNSIHSFTIHSFIHSFHSVHSFLFSLFKQWID